MASLPLEPLAAGGPALAGTVNRLRLYQLVSPALPVGAFSYSEGLEVLCQSGQLSSAAAVESWILAELARGVLPLEAAALPELMASLAAWRGGQAEVVRREARAAVLEQDAWLAALREAPEVRAQQRQMGASLLGLLADLGWPLPPGSPEEKPPKLGWPAAWAWALVVLEIQPGEGVEAYLHSWVANQLSAAVRLVPLGPTEAQRLLLRLGPSLAAQASALSGEKEEPPCEPRWNGGVGAALAQLRHGELYSRLFRS